jgi:tetratricopeptide (TPR) repeat protein
MDLKCKFLTRLIAAILTLSLCFSTFPVPASAWSLFGKDDPHNADMRFSAIYPVSFWDSTAGKVTMYVGSAVVVGVITYCTAGTGAWTGVAMVAKWVGGTIGTMMGATGGGAILAGLAWLGGGTVASGGLGVLGGVMVVNVIGDLAVSVVLDQAISTMPKNSSHGFLEIVKLRMFYDRVTPAAAEDLKDLKKVLEGNGADLEKTEFFLKRVERKLIETIQSGAVDKTTPYNYLLLSLIQYNNGEFDAAKASVQKAREFTNPKHSSVLDYVDALLCLGDGKEKEACDLLLKINRTEPEIIQPYVVMAQVYFDNGNYMEAFNALRRGLNDADDDDCTLNYMAGNCLYAYGDYKQAVEYYKDALSNMTINEVEALYKLNISRCYKKLGNSKQAEKWLNDAISEVSKNEAMIAELKAAYNQN